MEAAIDFPPLTREKLDRLTVKRTAKFEAQGYSVDHRATFAKTPSATRCADLIGDSSHGYRGRRGGALARYEDIRKDRTAMVVQKTAREQEAGVQSGIGQ